MHSISPPRSTMISRAVARLRPLPDCLLVHIHKGSSPTDYLCEHKPWFAQYLSPVCGKSSHIKIKVGRYQVPPKMLDAFSDKLVNTRRDLAQLTDKTDKNLKETRVLRDLLWRR